MAMANVKGQKSQLVLNGKPFLMTVGSDEIKVLDASQSITVGSVAKQHPTQ